MQYISVIKEEEAIKTINLKTEDRGSKAPSIKMGAMNHWIHLAKKIRQSPN